MKISFENKIGFAEILALLAILFSLFSFVKSCNNEGKMKNYDFIVRANNYKPQIVVEGNPEINSLSMVIDDIIKTDFGAEIEGYLKLSVKLRLKNIGNSKANIQAIISIDTLSFQEDLRSFILDSKGLKIEKDKSSNNRNLELFPNEVKEVNLNKKLSKPKNNIFNIHIIILYSNDLNNLFDTYLWYEYSFQEEFVIKEGMYIFKGMEFEFSSEFINMLDNNISSKVYSIDELNKVITNYELHLK